MASRTSILFTILLAFPFFITHLSARPRAKATNNDLLNTVCSTTQNPSFCLKALKSDPRSATADVHGLAKISIDMARAIAVRTFGFIGSLDKRETNPQLKKRYALCSVSYDNAIGYAEAAEGSLGTQDYQSLSIQASAVMSEVDECEESFKTPPPGSSTIRLANRMLDDLSDIIYEITFLL